MSTLTKRATVYLKPNLHRALRLKSVETARSLSDIVNEAVQIALAEDAEDMAAFDERSKEPVISYEAALKELKRHGKI